MSRGSMDIYRQGTLPYYNCFSENERIHKGCVTGLTFQINKQHRKDSISKTKMSVQLRGVCYVIRERYVQRYVKWN